MSITYLKLTEYARELEDVPRVPRRSVDNELLPQDWDLPVGSGDNGEESSGHASALRF